VFLGIAVGIGLWRWAGRRPAAFVIAVLCTTLGSALAFSLLAWFGKVPRDSSFTMLLRMGRYALLGTTIAASCLAALCICCPKFRSLEMAALVLSAGTVGGLVAMSGMTSVTGDLNGDLPWLFPIAMAFWQALVCATIGYGLSREAKPN
jgi:hypothetical protein